MSGIISAYEVKGIEKYGVGVMAKHFVLNDAEEGRLGQAVWINEQALREIYLKAYQATFEAQYGMDAALKAADVRMCAYFEPPSETNFSGGYLTGTQSACKAACDAFADAVVFCVENPLKY